VPNWATNIRKSPWGAPDKYRYVAKQVAYYSERFKEVEGLAYNLAGEIEDATERLLWPERFERPKPPPSPEGP
jgi:hypothetical protein